MARDPDDPERRILATTKCNIAVEPASLAYRLVDTGHGCARVEWETGTVDHTAASLLRPAEDDDERTDRDEAADWLTGYLEQQGGTAPKANIDKAARAAGIAPATLKRARTRAGVHYESSGFPRRTFWLLPDAVGSQSAQSDQPSEPEPTEPTGDPTGGSDAEICICGTALSTTVQRQRGICNRCWVAGRRSA